MAAVTNPHRYDLGLNRTYADMARHCGTAILAARPRRPKDKAKVEVAVQIAQRWILARLGNQRFFSPADLNSALRELLGDLNARRMRGFGASRSELFAEIDRPRRAPSPPSARSARTASTRRYSRKRRSTNPCATATSVARGSPRTSTTLTIPILTHPTSSA
jgi:hypothetical protein